MSAKLKIVSTDLDGTLFNSRAEISPKNLKTIHKLKKTNCLFVIATGRSVYSAKTSLPNGLPLDYLVSSSGACLLDWKNDEVIKSYNLPLHHVEHVFQVLNKRHIDFTIQEAVPENHKYSYILKTSDNPDFKRRNSLYPGFAKQIREQEFRPAEACQFISIVQGDKAISTYESIREELSHLKVIRSTSPIDHNSLWIEIYAPEVSKANGVQYLADHYQVDRKDILVIGNDYNDLDMLNWAENAFVVENAPDDIKSSFPTVASNDDDGFSEAVEKWF